LLVFTFALGFIKQAIRAVQVLGVILETVIKPCVFGHSACSPFDLCKMKAPCYPVLEKENKGLKLCSVYGRMWVVVTRDDNLN